MIDPELETILRRMSLEQQRELYTAVVVNRLFEMPVWKQQLFIWAIGYFERQNKK